MRKLLIAGAFAATAISAPAFAQNPTVIFTPSIFTLPPFTTATVFQNFESAPGSNTPYVAGANETITGDVASASGTIPGEQVDPDSNPANKYLAIENGSYKINLGGSVQFFSFILGSLDTYNKLTLTFSDGSTRLYQGGQIIGAPTINSFPANPFGNSTPSISGRVSFDAGSTLGIIAAEFSSTQAAFEIDDLASAVPEPATWGMMILGFGVIGSQLRTRRRTAKVAIA